MCVCAVEIYLSICAVMNNEICVLEKEIDFLDFGF